MKIWMEQRKEEDIRSSATGHRRPAYDDSVLPRAGSSADKHVQYRFFPRLLFPPEEPAAYRMRNDETGEGAASATHSA